MKKLSKGLIAALLTLSMVAALPAPAVYACSYIDDCEHAPAVYEFRFEHNGHDVIVLLSEPLDDEMRDAILRTASLLYNDGFFHYICEKTPYCEPSSRCGSGFLLCDRVIIGQEHTCSFFGPWRTIWAGPSMSWTMPSGRLAEVRLMFCLDCLHESTHVRYARTTGR